MVIKMNDYREKLKGQIRNSFGNLVYTYTSHLKQVEILKRKMSILKNAKRILSAFSSAGIFSTIFNNYMWVKICSSLFSFSLLYLTYRMRDLDFNNLMNRHIKASDALRHVRDDYVSLLVDFDNLDTKQIKENRDELQCRASFIYDNSPKTSRKAYKRTQCALKCEEEQYLTDQEVDQMLFKDLRRNK